MPNTVRILPSGLQFVGAQIARLEQGHALIQALRPVIERQFHITPGAAEFAPQRFRSLSKAFDKERYAKVEVMSSSLVEQSKMNEVIVARTALSIVWLGCACQGCPQ